MAGLGDLLGGLLGGSRSSSGGNLGNVLGGLLGGSSGKSTMMTALLPLVVGMLSGGGLAKILAQLQNKGLSGQANSWVGKGPNQALSGDQATEAVGANKIAEIAKKLGVSNSEAANAVAELLPKLVDHVTPKGKVPSSGRVDSALNKLQKAAAQA